MLLKKSSLIDIIATSGKPTQEHLEKACLYLEKLGYKVRYQEDLIGSIPIYANTKEKRLKHLIEALEAKDSEAIWCLRGGAGATSLIPDLFKTKKPLKEKLFIGFSDITCLHLFFHQHWGWTPLHGPTLSQILDPSYEKECIKILEDILSGEIRSYVISNLEPLNAPSKQERTIRAAATGGNHSLVQCSLGSSWKIKSDGRILILEDIGEEVYRTLERLEHLSQNGIFDKIEALVFGDFNFREKRPEDEKLYEEQFKRFAEEKSFPILKTNKIGHGPWNIPFLVGKTANLKLGENPSLSFNY